MDEFQLSKLWKAISGGGKACFIVTHACLEVRGEPLAIDEMAGGHEMAALLKIGWFSPLPATKPI